ncbi:MAG: flagellar basal body-associated FliL family protein [Myxococcota bacterium]|nr:flagellar basal body-associated FliL family protein [Myxococcota bacterium]
MKHTLSSLFLWGSFCVGCNGYGSLHTMQEDWESSREDPTVGSEQLDPNQYERQSHAVYIEEDGNLYFSKQLILPLFDSPISLRDGTTYHFTLEVALGDPRKENVESFLSQKASFQNDIVLYLSDRKESDFEGRRGKMDMLEDLKIRMSMLIKACKIDIRIDDVYITRFYSVSPVVSYTP